MCATIAKTDAGQLFEIAEAQQGYFTAGQAVDAGYARSTHSYHVDAGNWGREHRGIYRLLRYPRSADGQLVLWSLWSRNRQGQPQGVYSHLTALRIKDLSDANPPRLHMTVPPGFRRNGGLPPVLALHKAKLAPGETTRDRGYLVTTPIRSIVDLAASGEADRDMIGQALREGLNRGLITPKQIAATLSRPGLPAWLRRLIEDAV